MEDDPKLAQLRPAKTSLGSFAFVRMKEGFIFVENGRRSQICLKWKTTSNLLKMEDDLNSFFKMDDYQIFSSKWKTTSILMKMKDRLIFLNG